jgi:hypothetical protein
MAGQPGRGTAAAGSAEGKADQMAALLKILRASGRHTAVDGAGQTPQHEKEAGEGDLAPAYPLAGSERRQTAQ